MYLLLMKVQGGLVLVARPLDKQSILEDTVKRPKTIFHEDLLTFLEGLTIMGDAYFVDADAGLAAPGL